MMISNDFAKEKMICFRFFSSKPPGIVARLGRLKSAYDLKECESLVGDVSLLADLGTIERQVAIDILMELGSDLAAKHEIIPVSMWVTMIQIMDWKDTGKIKSVRSKFSVDVIRKNRQLLLKSVDEMLKTSPRNANRLIMALINYSGNDDEDIVDEILHLPWKKSSKVWEAIMAKYELSPNQKLEKMSTMFYHMAIVDKVDCTDTNYNNFFKHYGILLKFKFLKSQFHSIVPGEQVYGFQFYDNLILSLTASRNYNCVYSTVLYLLHSPEMALPSSFVLGHAIRQLYHSGHATMAADLVYKSVDAELLLPDHILKSEYKTIPKKMPLNLHLFYQIIDGILSVQDQVTLGRKIIEKASLYGFDQTTVQGYFSRGDLYLNSWKAGIEASKVVSTTLKSSSQDHTFKVIRKLAMDNNFVLAMKVADEVIERQKGNASCVFFAMLVTNRVFPRRFQTFESMITNLVKNGQAIYPDIFNAWIKFHLISGNAIKAREIFSEMQKYVSPDLYTYMSFVSYEFRRKRPDLAQIWFEESIQNGIPATTAGLSIMATGYLKAGNLDKALEFYGTMIGYDFKNRHSIPVRDSQYIDDESIGFFTRILWEDRLYNDLCLVISKTALTSKFQESYQTWLMVAMNLLKRNNFCAIALTGTCNHIPSMNLALTSVGKTVIFDPKIITEMSAFLQRVALNANSDDEGMSLKMFKLCFMFLREPALIEKVFGLRHSFLVEQYLKLIVLEMMRMAKDFDCFGFADHPAFILLKSAIPGDFKVVAYVEKMLSNLPDKAEITELSCSLDSIPLHSSKENPLLHMTLMNEVAGKTKSMVIRPTNFSSQIYYIAKNTGKKAAAEFFEKESVNRTVDLTVISNLIRHGLKPKLLETVPNILEYLLEKQLSPTPSFYALLYQRYYKSEKNRNMIFSKLVTAVGENEAYALIIAAFCKVGRMDYADMHLQVFLKKGYLPPDDRFYFNLMTGYVNIGQFENSLYFLGKIIGYDLDDFSRHPDNPLPPDGMTDSDKYHHGFKLSFIKSVISKSIYPDPTPRIEKVVYFLTLFSKNNRQLSVDIIPKIISFSLFNNSCWGLNLLYLNSSTSQELLKDASILLYTKSKQFIYHPKLVESIMKVIKLKVGDYHPTGKSIAQACFEMMFSCDDNPSKLYLELILYTAVSLDFEFEPNLERILEEEAGKEFLNSLKNSNLFEKEKFDLRIPTPKTFSSILEETLPFAAPLVNLFQPQLFPPYVPREGIVKKPFMERYAEALICGEVEVDKLLKEYPDMAEAINKLDMPTKPKVD